MPSPFPGMDPYLERVAIWPTFHFRLVSGLTDRLDAALPSTYWVSVDENVYRVEPGEIALVGRPDTSVVSPPGVLSGRPGSVATLARGVAVTVPVPELIREHFLEIRDHGSGEVVTMVEILSPTNKRPGRGRQKYMRKRNSVLSSQTSLVEVDLLRDWERMPLFSAPEHYDYGILISPGYNRPDAVLHAFTVREPVPSFDLPLRFGEPAVVIDLASVVLEAYDRGRFGARIDYGQPPEPPLSPEDGEWAAAQVREPG